MVVQLRFDAIDRFDQVLLIAAGKGHARDGMLYFNESLVYCGLLSPIHGQNLNPFAGSRKSCAAGVRKQRSPAVAGGAP